MKEWKQIPHATLNKVLIQRRDEQKIKKTETIRRQALQHKVNNTPLNTPLKQVLMQIKDDPSLKWPEKMKGDPNKCNRNKYCRFHRDHEHNTDECFNLKQQIENLIRQGKFP